MKSASLVILTGFVALGILHQDQWNWDKADLVLGFMPVGLAYHVAYSVVAAIFWALILKFAWPHALERWAEGRDGEEKVDADS